MKKIILIALLALSTSVFAVNFNIDNVMVIQGYGANIKYMDYELNGFPFNFSLVDSQRFQIRIDSPYQFQAVGFHFTCDDTMVVFEKSNFEKGNLFGNDGVFSCEQIAENKVYVYLDIPQEKSFNTDGDYLIARFLIKVKQLESGKAVIYIVVD